MDAMFSPTEVAILMTITTVLTIWIGTALLLTLQRRSESQRVDGATAQFLTAVELLGSDKSTVRVGGLLALERLGQTHPALRQVAIDMICAYLRGPYQPPATFLRNNVPSSPEHPTVAEPTCDAEQDATRGRELQIRLIAQRILRDHTRPMSNTKKSPDYWLGTAGERMNIDLTGATLFNFGLAGCAPGAITLWNAQLHGSTHLSQMQVHGSTILSNARFHGSVHLSWTRFRESVAMRNTQFHDYAEFIGVCFDKRADLSGAQFHRWAKISDMRFHMDAPMAKVQFHRYADLERTWFHGPIDVQGVQFHEYVNLGDVRFFQYVKLSEVRFHGNVNLSGAEFRDDADLSGLRFDKDVDLRESQFHGNADLSGAQFSGRSDIDMVVFHQDVDLAGALVRPGSSLPAGWATRPGPEEGLLVVASHNTPAPDQTNR